MKFLLFLSVLFVLFLVQATALGFGGNNNDDQNASVPGGWSPASINSKRVGEAASFAVHTKYPRIVSRFQVLQAYQQVVRGVNYKLTVAVYLQGVDCRVDDYIVWDDLGTFNLIAAETDITAPCPTLRRE